ncbi:response regulator transcription factor [Reyranella sp.]|uniref:response regulator transcription factor n=1 Tax=Reyranella sp. TaxID=1929291 RepID=UPI003D0D6AF2
MRLSFHPVFNAGRLPAMAGDIRSVAPSNRIVFIAAENPFARRSMAVTLGDTGWQVREITSARALLAEPQHGVPSCLVLDELVVPEWLAVERAEIPIICVTGHTDVLSAVQAMKAGAVDVLAKPLRLESLIGSIELALERSEALLLQGREERALRDRYAALSQRERQVMSLVVSGLLNKQVGGELGISEITVKAHRGKVMRKMNVRTLAALVNIAGKLRLEPYAGPGSTRQTQPASPAVSSSISALAWRMSDVSNPSMKRP